MRPDQLERDRRYLATPRGRFKQAKARAKQRGIVWKLTFEQWWAIWEKSGKWELRGRGRGKYCMGRYGDLGAYEDGNVAIVLQEVNTKDMSHKRHGQPHKRSDAGVKRHHTKRATSVTFLN